MSRKGFFWFSASIVLAAVSFADAQQTGKVYRIGYLGGRGPFSGALEQGLRDHGYEPGKNLVIEYRPSEGNFDRLPALAAELVRLNVDVIVTGINPTIVAAMRATSKIPIVMTFANDPVGAGLVASLAQPGSNLTGFDEL